MRYPSIEMLNAVWDWYQSSPTVYRKIVYFECEILLTDYYTGRVAYR